MKVVLNSAKYSFAVPGLCQTRTIVEVVLDVPRAFALTGATGQSSTIVEVVHEIVSDALRAIPVKTTL